MLERLRQQSRSFIIWILFGIIIVVFIISFGPQANAQLGCGATHGAVMEIGDRPVGEDSWRWALNAPNRFLHFFGRGFPSFLDSALGLKTSREQQHFKLDMLVARELLAHGAQKAGFRVSTEEVNRRIKDGDLLLLGWNVAAKGADGEGLYFKDNYFDYKLLEWAARSVGVSNVDRFIEEQRSEILAEAMRSFLHGSVHVSREELLADYMHRGTAASIEYVRFSPSRYQKTLVLGDDQVRRYLAEHEAEVRQKFAIAEPTYKGTSKQVKVRQIFIAAKSAPKDRAAEPGVEGGRGGATGAAPAAARAADPGLALARSLRAKLRRGADFAALADKYSDDGDAARPGGDLGWRSLAAPGLGDLALAEALRELGVGDVSEVVATDRGYYLLTIEAEREGDLGYEQVKEELARDLAAAHYAREQARRDAEAALAKAAAGTALDEQFKAAPPDGDLPFPEHGATVREEEAVAAKWSVKGATAPHPTAPRPRERGGEVTHYLLRAGPFTRNPEQIPGLGRSAEMVRALFDEMTVGQVADRVYEVGGDYVVFRLVDRSEPEIDEFERRIDELRADTRDAKGRAAVLQWLDSQCRSLRDRGQLVVNQEYTAVEQDIGSEQRQMPYTPCQYFAHFAFLPIL